MRRETARYERMTDSLSRQLTEVTATSEADGEADTNSGQDQLPTDDPMNTQHDNCHAPKHHHETCAFSHQLFTAVRPPVADSYHAEHPDITQTPHTEFHHSHGIRQHVESSNPQIHQLQY